MKTKTENDFLRIAIIRKMKEEELTMYAISKRTGISNQTIREYLKNGRSMRIDYVLHILDKLNINITLK